MFRSYLSAEQSRSLSTQSNVHPTTADTLMLGLNYRVTVDSDGRLRWARSNELVDTTAGRWQDSGDGSGIVRFDASRRGHITVRTSFNTDCIGSDSDEVPASNIDNHNSTHYVESKDIRNPLKRWFRRHLTIKGWIEILLKKTIRRNTWIYVADKQCMCLYLLIIVEYLEREN